MELLRFPAQTAEEETTIHTLMAHMVYLSVTLEIEDVAITIRRQYRRIRKASPHNCCWTVHVLDSRRSPRFAGIRPG